MRILLAPDKFKGTLTAPEVCAAMARGIHAFDPTIEIDVCPVSDGGEGFVDAICGSVNATRHTVRVTGPLPEMRVDATFAVIDSDQTAVIEMASAAGLMLLKPADRNPLYTTTFGVGELMTHAANLGCKKILLGIGGSATNDAGIGCLQGCGCHVILKSGGYAKPTEPLCARDLDDVLMVKSHRGSPLDGVEIVVACDVTNPLYGPEGAAKMYGPQKGASITDVIELDRLVKDFATRAQKTPIAESPGSGAAGGIGFGLVAFMGASTCSGFELVREATDLDARIAAADLVITGEGKLDITTAYGKPPDWIQQVAHLHHGVPSILICGESVPYSVPTKLFCEVHSLSARFGMELAFSRPASCIEQTVLEVLPAWRAGANP